MVAGDPSALAGTDANLAGQRAQVGAVVVGDPPVPGFGVAGEIDQIARLTGSGAPAVDPRRPRARRVRFAAAGRSGGVERSP